MDSREDVIVTLIKKMLIQNKPYSDIVELAVAKDQISNNPPYLSDESIHGVLAASPLKLATKIMLDTIDQMEPEDEEYSTYREFFDEHFKKAKKDRISKDLMLQYDDGLWQPAIAKLEATKSYAKGKGLKPASVMMHFVRYEMKKKGSLLVDFEKWDGIDRIKQLGEFIKIKNHSFDVFEDALKEWGANLFRRLNHDVYQNRCIILKGNQGIGKDQLVKNLLRGLGPYYSKFSCHRNENDCWSEVTSKLVLHIEEFDQTGRIGVPFLKDLITRDWVTYRDPYGRKNLTRKCIGSFISSVNIDAILRDETGNRRFAVFEIESIDWDYPKDDSAQYLAQFFHLYRTGFFAKPETWKSVTDSNSQFEQVDMVPELLNAWDVRAAGLYKQTGTDGLLELTYGQAFGVISDIAKHAGWKPRSICTMLKSHGRSRHTATGSVYWSNMIKFKK